MIGGTGLDTLPHFRKAAVLTVDTPWGKPSSDITILEHPSPTTGQPIPIAFLARHGPHHELNPSEVPSRANMAALRKIGVRCVIAFSAAGSLAEEVKPRDFVVPDQAIDRTKGVRPYTFFEGGFVCHVPFADPFDKRVGDVVRRCGHSLEGEGVRLHDTGTVIVMGTPFFSFLCFVANVQQKGLNSALAPNPTCTEVGVAPSSTCRPSPRPSWRPRRKWRTRSSS